MDSKEVTILTASFGNFDGFKKQPVPVRYYNEETAHYPMYNQDARMKAKFYKMLAHRVTTSSLIGWVDGNVQIKTSEFTQDLIKALGDADIVISKHPCRKNVYEEADFIIGEIERGNKYLKDRYSIEVLKKELFNAPLLDDLYYCGIFLRRNTPKVNAAFEDWFMDNVLYSSFDQNSFVKMVHKHNLNVAVIDFGGFYDNDYYSLSKHNK